MGSEWLLSELGLSSLGAEVPGLCRLTSDVTRVLLPIFKSCQIRDLAGSPALSVRWILLAWRDSLNIVVDNGRLATYHCA